MRLWPPARTFALVAELGERLDRFGGRRRPVVLERRRLHAQPTTTGSVSQPRTVDVGAIFAFGQIDVPLGEAVEQLVERDPPFESRQRGAEAEVRAVAEGQV